MSGWQDGGKAVLAEERDLRRGGIARRTGFKLVQEKDSSKKQNGTVVREEDWKMARWNNRCSAIILALNGSYWTITIQSLFNQQELRFYKLESYHQNKKMAGSCTQTTGISCLKLQNWNKNQW